MRFSRLSLRAGIDSDHLGSQALVIYISIYREIDREISISSPCVVVFAVFAFELGF